MKSSIASAALALLAVFATGCTASTQPGESVDQTGQAATCTTCAGTTNPTPAPKPAPKPIVPVLTVPTAIPSPLTCPAGTSCDLEPVDNTAISTLTYSGVVLPCSPVEDYSEYANGNFTQDYFIAYCEATPAVANWVMEYASAATHGFELAGETTAPVALPVATSGYTYVEFYFKSGGVRCVGGCAN